MCFGSIEKSYILLHPVYMFMLNKFNSIKKYEALNASATSSSLLPVVGSPLSRKYSCIFFLHKRNSLKLAVPATNRHTQQQTRKAQNNTRSSNVNNNLTGAAWTARNVFMSIDL